MRIGLSCTGVACIQETISLLQVRCLCVWGDNVGTINRKCLWRCGLVKRVRRLLMFPKGNNVNFLSVYLDVADSASLSQGWSIFANFGLSVVNQRNRRYIVRKDTKHQFNARESDWGFTSFISLGELRDLGKGFF
ncbi:hypothetical protein IFM89_000308 [Coptis chinensis]|uniref:MATH domain-containing protein n=1 Tax=Coptis chinensis TaxID=261450 RepID=A0A835LHW5_9MAGN|nr:hypothetical protein IFM89_000308 [Coptis chinensis]